MTHRIKLKRKASVFNYCLYYEDIFTSLFHYLLSALIHVPSHIFPVKLGITSGKCWENYLGALGNNLKHLLELSCEIADIVNVPTIASAFGK